MDFKSGIHHLETKMQTAGFEEINLESKSTSEYHDHMDQEYKIQFDDMILYHALRIGNCIQNTVGRSCNTNPIYFTV